MSKLIIHVPGRPNLNGFRIREFVWSEAHKKHIYLGRELGLDEFNVLFDKAWKNNADLMPKAMVVGAAAPALPVVPVATAIATITASREITADEAEAVLARLRPERLKQKPGRKSQPLIELAG